MHDDLEPLLNDSVYSALDAYTNAPFKEREKVVNLCRSQNGSNFFNPTINAAFGHQISLLLAEGVFFAIAGRSAAQPDTERTGFGHGINKLSTSQKLQNKWPVIL